jgi:small subunit ribosomal protein S9
MANNRKPTKKTNKMPKNSTVSGKYIQGIGRRKQSVVTVKVFFFSGKKGKKAEMEILVNGKPYQKHFPLQELRDIVVSPLKAASSGNVEKVLIFARGGGVRGQAESSRLGIARALTAAEGSFKKTLKDLGYLTRDARVVERKKSGLKKARRAPQFSKR